MGTRGHTLLKQYGCTYYFTTTVLDWKHVFIKHSVISILIKSILFFQNNRHVLTNGYCLMPNHFHWIFTLKEDYHDVISVIRTFKSYTATQILKKLKNPCVFDHEPLEKIFIGNSNVKQERSNALSKGFSHPIISKRSFHQFWQKDSDI